MSVKPGFTCRYGECPICTASQSRYVAGEWRCDKGALTMSQAEARKRRVDEAWTRFVAQVFPPWPRLE